MQLLNNDLPENTPSDNTESASNNLATRNDNVLANADADASDEGDIQSISPNTPSAAPTTPLTAIPVPTTSFDGNNTLSAQQGSVLTGPAPFNSTIRPELTGLTGEVARNTQRGSAPPESTALTGDATGSGIIPPGTPPELAFLSTDAANDSLISGVNQGVTLNPPSPGISGINTLPPAAPPPAATPPASNPQPVPPAVPPAPVISVAPVQSTIVETDTSRATLSFIITRTRADGSAQVNWSLTGSDTSLLENSVTQGTAQFADGQLSTTVVVTIAGNTRVNGDQTLTVTLSSPTNGHTLGTAQAATTVYDNDGTLQIQAAGVSVLEGTTDEVTYAEFVVTRTNGRSNASVDWTAQGLDETDFEGPIPSGTLNFSAGELSKTIRIPIRGDQTVEPDEILTVTLGNPSPNITITQGTATTTILNDDGWVSINANQTQVAEGDTGKISLISFTVSRTNGNGSSSVDWSISGIDLDDLANGALQGTIEFAPGQTSRDIVLQIRGDRTIEANETAVVTLSNPQGNARIDAAQASTTITNDDFGVTLSGIQTEVAEGAENTQTAITFVISRSADMTQAGEVQWRLVRWGTHAADSTDFVVSQNGLNLSDGMPSGTVTFVENGTNQHTVTVYVKGDNIAEIDETYGVILMNPSTGMQIINGEAYGVIETDESVYSVQAVENTTLEGNGSDGIQTFIVSRTGNTTVAGSIDFVIEGYGELPADAIDFATGQPLNGTLDFAAGQTERIVQVQLSGDNVIEGEETWSFTLQPVSDNAQVDVGAAYVSIVNDDQSISLAATNAIIREGNDTSQPLQFTITRTGELSIPATVQWQVTGRGINPVDGTDFGGMLPSGVIQFEAGQSEAVISFSPLPDSIREQDEGLQVVITSTTPGLTITQDTANGVIRNDDVTLTVDAVALSGPEGDPGAPGTLTLAVERARDLLTSTTVNWQIVFEGNNPATAADFADGTVFSGTLTFTRGVQSQAVVLNLNPNSLLEADKDFRVVLSNPSAGTQIVTVSTNGKITNDDVTFNLVPGAHIAEGSAETHFIEYTVERAGDLSGTDVIGWSLLPGNTNPVDIHDFGGTWPNGSLTFNPGQSTQTIRIPITPDSTLEADESFIIQLGSPNPGATIETGQAGGVILNDDHTFSVTVDTASVAEGAAGQSSEIRFLVSRTGDTTGAGQVSWRIVTTSGDTVSGADFAGGVLPSGILNFTAGQTEQFVTLDIAGDYAMEQDENLRIELYDPATGSSVANGTAEATIVNDDVGLAIMTTSSHLAEQDSGTVIHRFTVTRSGVLSQTTTVDWAISGDVDAADFGGILPSGTLTFAPGVETQVIEIAVSGDTQIETTEAFTVTLSNASNHGDITTNSAQASIIADDISFAIAAEQTELAEGADGTQVLRFTITRSGDTTTPAIIHWEASGLQASDFIDATAFNGDLQFDANELTKTLEFTLKADAQVESNETLTVTITNPGNNPAQDSTYIEQASAGTLVRNDDTGLALNAGPVQNSEGQENTTTEFTFTITRTGVLGASTIDWKVMLPETGSPASLADFASDQDILNNNDGFPSGQVTFIEGQETANIAVRIQGDRSIELDEAFQVVLVNPPANTELINGTAQGIITNDDLGFSIAAVSTSQAEGQAGTTAFTFTVTRAGNLDAVAFVDWSIPLSGNLSTADFSALGDTLTFAPQEASKTLTIYVNGDLDVENDETFSVEISNARLENNTALDIIDATASATILNDDQQFQVSSPESIIEGNSGTKTLTFTITRTGNTSAEASVAYAVSATAGINASDTLNGLPSGTLMFEAGQTEKTVTVTIVGDTIAEDNEGLTLTLDNPSAGTISPSQGQATTVITNDDTYYSLSAPVAAYEGSSGEYTDYVFTITRTGVDTNGSVQWKLTNPSGNLSTSDFDTSDQLGSNNNFPSGTVNFTANGPDTQTFTVRVKGDVSLEGDEPFEIVLSNPSGGLVNPEAASATTTILNDDAVFSISADTVTAWESNDGGQTTVTFTVTRNGALHNDQTVDWSLQNHPSFSALDLVDGQPTSGTLSFTNGQTTQTITIQVKGDNQVEDDAVLTVSLASPSANSAIASGQGSATTTVNNDDAAFSIAALSADKAEGDASYTAFTFTVTRSDYTSQTNTINWRVDPSVATSVSADDFYFSQPSGVSFDNDGYPGGTLTFANGVSSQTITVYVRSDSKLESNENLKIMLTNASAGSEIDTSSATGIVRNDDAQYNITSGTLSQVEGDSGLSGPTFTYTVTRTGNTDRASTVEWYVPGGSGSNPANAYDFVVGSTRQLPSGTLSFAAGETSKTFTVRAYGDTGLDNYQGINRGSVEANETFQVVLRNPSSGSEVGSNSQFESTITNDDTLVTIEWTQARQAEKIAGESTTYTITLTRSGDTAKTSTVNWSVTGFSLYDYNSGQWEYGTDAADFSGITSNSVVFASGETSKTITFTVAGDNTIEDDEWFRVDFTNGGGIDELYTSNNGSSNTYLYGQQLNSHDTSTITLIGEVQRDESIFNLDSTPVTGNQRAEGDTPADQGAGDYIEHTFTIHRTISTSGSAWVEWKVQTAAGINYATDLDDFYPGQDALNTNSGLPSGRVEFNDGETSKTITIRTATDNLGEFNESFRVYLSDVSPGSSIDESDAASVVGTNNYVTLTNDDTRFDVYNETAEEAGDLVFSVERSGDVRGIDSVDWVITVPGTETGNETNNDTGTWYKLDPSDLDIDWILENNGHIANLQWNATERTFSGTFTFTDGQTSHTITLRTLSDTLTETWRESLSMSLSNPQNLDDGEVEHEDIETPTVGSGGAVGTVYDNEPDPLISVTSDTAQFYEGTSTSKTITFTLTRTDLNDHDGALNYPTTVVWKLTGTNLNEVYGLVNLDAEVFSYGGDATNVSKPNNGLTYGEVSFAAGETQKTVTVTFTGDTAVETQINNLNFSVLSAAEAYNVVGNSDGYGPANADPAANNVSVTYNNDDVQLWINGFNSNPLPTIEAYEGKPLSFSMVRNGRLDHDITIQYTIVNVSTANADFASGTMTGSFVLAGGQSYYNISLSDVLAQDGIDASSIESFKLQLNAPSDVTGSTVRFGSTGYVASSQTQLELNGRILEASTNYSLSPVATSQNEGDDGQYPTYTLNVSRNGYTGETRLYWRIEGIGTDAATADDFGGTFPSGVLRFEPGVTAGQISFQIAGDRTVEKNENFRVVLYEEVLVNAGITREIEYNSTNLTIVNDDTGIQIYGAALTESDADQTITFTVQRSGVTTGQSTMNWILVNDSTSAADFVGPTSGTITFNANDTIKTISVTLKGDVTPEDMERFYINLTNISSDVTDLIETSATGVVKNDDSSFAIAALAAEGQENGVHTFAITRSHDTDQYQTVRWTLVFNGSANADDFAGQLLTGTVTFEPGQLSKTITITPNNDSQAEQNEDYTVQISLEGGTSGDVITTDSAQGLIVNDDAGYRISANQTEAAEGHAGSTAFTFTVTRTGNISAGGSVDWVLSSDAANALDFLTADSLGNGGLPSGTLTFDAGQPSQTITILVAGDNVQENDETFTVTLRNPSAGQIVENEGAADSIILNDDATISIAAASATKAEGDSNQTAFTFTITRTGSLSDTRTVDWAVTGSGANAANELDFGGALPSGTLTLPAGQDSVTLTVYVSGDLQGEPDENFTVTLSNPSEGTSIDNASATATIEADDIVFSIAAPENASEGADGDTTYFDFVVTRSGNLTGAQTLNWAITGIGAHPIDSNDFVDTSGTVSFAAGETQAIVRVAVTGDYRAENDEGFRVTLSSNDDVVFDTASADAVILNDDVAVAIAATDAQHIEGHDGAQTVYTFTVTRSGNVDLPGTIDWSVDLAAGSVNADDFLDGVLPSGTLSFEAGQLSQTISVTVIGDRSVEADETLVIRLANPSAGTDIVTPTATGTVVSDDIEWTLAALSTPTEGDSGAIAYTFTVSRTGSLSATSLDWQVTGTGDVPADVSDFFDGAFPNGTIHFERGVSSQTLTVWVAGDAILESDKSFTLTLTPPDDSQTHTFANDTLDVVIRNDDDVMAISATSNEGPEGSGDTGTLTFTITRTGSLEGTSTVGWRIAHGDTTDADFVQSVGTITFADGQAEYILTVPVSGDRSVEIDEAFTVELFNPGAGSTIDPESSSANGIIRNDDIDLTVNAVVAEVIEGDGDNGGRLHYTVTRTGDLSAATTFNWAVLAGSAQADDFAGGVLPSGTITFAAGETSKDIYIDINGDGAAESTEQFTLHLSDVDAAVDIVNNNLTGNIGDDDDILTLSAVNAMVAEGDEGITLFTFRIDRSGTSIGEASVQWNAAGIGTHPLAGDEFSATSGIVTFADGETFKTFTVSVKADELGEYDESFEVWLSDASFGSTINTSVNDGKVGATVINDDPVLFIAADASATLEGQAGDETAFTFTVTRSGDLSGTSSALWQVVPFGAISANAEDFGGYYPSGVVAFGVGETSKTITVYITGDAQGERDETFSVVLSEPEGASILEPSAHTAITNDDTGLVVSAVGEAARYEGQAGDLVTFTYRIERLGDSTGTVSVDWHVEGTGSYPGQATDFAGGNFPGGTVTFNEGETFKDVIVQIAGDNTLGPDQTFDVVLSSPQGIGIINDRASGTILNDDSQFSVNALDATLNEGNNGSTTVFRFTVTRSGETELAASIDWSVLGTGAEPVDADDFVGGTFPSGTLNFAEGETSKTIEIEVYGDDIGEADEQFLVQLSGNSGGTSINPLQGSARATVRGDDVALTIIALDSQRPEGQPGDAEALSYRILRAGPDDQAIVIQYAITGGVNSDDFETPLTGTVTLAAGVSEMVFTLPIAGDTLREGNESFNITFTHPTLTGGNTVLSGTITDDDLGLALAGPDSVVEGNEGTAQTLSYDLTRNPSAEIETFYWKVISGNGQGIDESDLVGGFASGMVTFAANATSTSFSFDVDGDAWVEANESFRIIISRTPDHANPILSKTGTIVNDDNADANANVLQGTAVEDTLQGLGGDDFLFGYNGSDSLSGGAGDDLLAGGSGADVLSGGSGADRFYYDAPTEGMDSILDFQPGTDLFTFNSAQFGNLGTLSVVSQASTGDVFSTLTALAGQADADLYKISFNPGQFRFDTGDNGELDELEAAISDGDHSGAAFFLISDGDVTRLYYDADTGSGEDGSQMVALAEVANQSDATALPDDVVQPQGT